MLWSILKILVFLARRRGARLRRRLDPRDPGRGADRLRQPRVLRLADRLRPRASSCWSSLGARAPEAPRLPRGACSASCSATRPRSAAISRAAASGAASTRCRDGMVALAAGDSQHGDEEGAAGREAAAAGRDLTRLLTAQAAEMSGDRAQGASRPTRRMLPDDRTRPVGVQGLMRLKLEEGDTDTAMALAKKAFALTPGQRAGPADALRPAVEAGGLGRRARDAERLDARAAAAARRRHPPRRGAVARRRPRGARRRQHRPRQRGGAAGQPAGADAGPGGGAGGAGACRERRRSARRRRR